jgi:hypothetical protein
VQEKTASTTLAMIKKIATTLFLGMFVWAFGFAYIYYWEGQSPDNATRGSIAGGVGAMIGKTITDIAAALKKKPPATHSP